MDKKITGRLRKSFLSLSLLTFACAIFPVAASAALNLTISGNTVSGNGGSGINVVNNGGTVDGSIKNNNISGNQTGVSMTNTGGGTFNMDMGTTAAGGANPGNNNITGNTTSINNNTGTNVPAQGNYFGPSGPVVTNGIGSTTDVSNPLPSARTPAAKTPAANRAPTRRK